MKVIRRLAAELAAVLRRSGEGVVVGHGSGSFGHAAAARHEVHRGISDPARRRGVAETQGRAAALHGIVLDAFRAVGLPAFSVAPSSAAVAEGGRLVEFATEPLARALEEGLLPVLYGDVVLDRSQGAAILSTEAVLLGVAQRLSEWGWTAERAVWAGTTDGIRGTDGGTIPVVDVEDPEAALAVAGPSEAVDVTGGMRHRLETALELARLGVPSWIGNGATPGALERVLLGEEVPGTRVKARPSSA